MCRTLILPATRISGWSSTSSCGALCQARSWMRRKETRCSLTVKMAVAGPINADPGLAQTLILSRHLCHPLVQKVTRGF
jgi:hypothetical protein